MKKMLLMLIVFPFIGHTQCLNYLTGDTAKAMELKEVVEKYTMFKLFKNMSSPIATTNAISYNDTAGFAGLMIGVKRTKKLVGTDVVFSDPVIFRIRIYGPAERIDKMVEEYFVPQIAPCNPKKSPTWLFWDNLKLVYSRDDENNGIAMKFIEIESSKY